MTRKVRDDATYSSRFDKTGYQRPPKGEPVFTTETPEQEKERLDYFRARTPDPTDADIPKNLIPQQDADGFPYLVEVQLRKEAVASAALDGETQTIETYPVKEATVPTGSPRKKKKGFALKQGEQTETVVRLLREHVAVGERFNVNLVYGWFSPTEKDRWYRAYGDQIAVKNKLMKAITNVAFSGKHLRLVVVKNVSRTWLLESKSGTSTRGLRTVAPKKSVKPTPKKVTAAAELGVPGYTLVAYNLDAKKIYKDKDGNLGTFEFTPYEL